jgi:hypothetical protein
VWVHFGDDDQHTLADAGLTWLGEGSLLADQLANGRVVARNDQFFPRGQLVNDLWQVRLRRYVQPTGGVAYRTIAHHTR